MCGFEVDGRRHTVLERVFPSGDANAPFVTRLQAGESPFRPRHYQIVPVQDGEIEELARGLHTHRVPPNILRAGAAIAVPIKSRDWITATTFEFRSEDICGHDTRRCDEELQRSSAEVIEADKQ